MKVLLLRPVARNDRFGLGPFFRIEPLGMEYIAAALSGAGHDVTLADLRFSESVDRLVRRHRPGLVGIAAMHALETDEVVDLAARVRALSPSVTILVGGHTAAAYPQPFLTSDVDAVVVDDGELTVPRVADAVAAARPVTAVPGLVLALEGEMRRTDGETGTLRLDDTPQPARHLVAPWRAKYACLAHRPVWLVETARGCPFRCSFCSIWQLHARSVRERSIASVAADFAEVGDSVFVADDLFWYHPMRSLALAHELRRRGIRKRWMLAQSRVDLVARHPDLLEAWRPIAADFDIFFGLESATNEGLRTLGKDATVDHTTSAIAVARALDYGVTGNFVIDPAWGVPDFERLWAFIDQHALYQAGFTILTPLPGTSYYEQMRSRLHHVPWSHFDMHHLLWEPVLDAHSFFALYCETWKRSVLNLRGRKSFWNWMREVDVKNAAFLVAALYRTQRLMDPAHYLAEYGDAARAGASATTQVARRSWVPAGD